jgi:hypothetical protein
MQIKIISIPIVGGERSAVYIMTWANKYEKTINANNWVESPVRTVNIVAPKFIWVGKGIK